MQEEKKPDPSPKIRRFVDVGGKTMSSSLSKDIAPISSQEIFASVEHSQPGILTRLQGVSPSHPNVIVTQSSEHPNLLPGLHSPGSMAFSCEAGK